MFASQAFANLWYHAARCKNPAFEDENEWRIIYRPPIPVERTLVNGQFEFDVAVRGHTLVPFHTVKFNRGFDILPAINEVVLGPKVSKETEHTLRPFLNIKGFGRTKISRAKASYRTL